MSIARRTNEAHFPDTPIRLGLCIVFSLKAHLMFLRDNDRSATLCTRAAHEQFLSIGAVDAGAFCEKLFELFLPGSF
jgi:hypothetical protein